MSKIKDIGAAIVAIVLGVFGGIALAILLSYLLRHKRGIKMFFEKVRKKWIQFLGAINGVEKVS